MWEEKQKLKRKSVLQMEHECETEQQRMTEFEENVQLGHDQKDGIFLDTLISIETSLLWDV